LTSLAAANDLVGIQRFGPFVSEVKPVRIASVVSLSKNMFLTYASNLY
jgi:hypothetical protein